MGTGDMDVLFGPCAEPGPFFRTELADDFPGGTHDHGTRRDPGARRDDRAGSDQALVADLRTVENHRPHSDEAFIANRAGVDHRPMTEGAISPHNGRQVVGQVDDRTVLHVRSLPDDDGFDVTPQDSPVKHTRIPAQSHIAHDPRIPGHKGGFGQLRLALEEFFKAFFDFHNDGVCWFS